MSTEDLPARLREVCDDAGGPSALAKKSGVPLRSLNEYLGGTKMPVDRAAAIADAGDVRLEWLATGEGPKKRGGTATIAGRTGARADGYRSSEGGRSFPPPPGVSDPHRAEYETVSARLDSSLLLRTAEAYFEFLERRRRNGKPEWSSAQKARGFLQVYLGLIGSGKVDESSIKEALDLFE